MSKKIDKYLKQIEVYIFYKLCVPKMAVKPTIRLHISKKLEKSMNSCRGVANVNVGGRINRCTFGIIKGESILCVPVPTDERGR